MKFSCGRISSKMAEIVSRTNPVLDGHRRQVTTTTLSIYIRELLSSDPYRHCQ